MEEKRDSLLDPYDDQVMIASHRGKFSSSVMENTSLAFLAAVGQERIWLRWILL